MSEVSYIRLLERLTTQYEMGWNGDIRKNYILQNPWCNLVSKLQSLFICFAEIISINIRCCKWKSS